jgi:hypothetical protein
MYAMVVRMSLDPDRRPDVITHFRSDVAGWAGRQHGFVSGQWFCTPQGGDGLGVVVFEDEADVAAAMRGPSSTAHDETRAWNIDRVEVFEQVAQADLAGG